MINLRAKGSEDGRWWSPDRDITSLYPATMRMVAERMNDISDPALIDIKRRLGVSDDDLGSAFVVYARIIKTIHSRHNIKQAFEDSGFQHTDAQALIGAVFLECMTRVFVAKYGSTIHKGYADPNAEYLQECLDSLKKFDKPALSWSQRLWKRLCLTWAIFTSPV